MNIKKTKYPFNVYCEIVGIRYSEDISKEEISKIDVIVDNIDKKYLDLLNKRFKELKDYRELSRELDISMFKVVKSVQLLICELMRQKYILENCDK